MKRSYLPVTLFKHCVVAVRAIDVHVYLLDIRGVFVRAFLHTLRKTNNRVPIEPCDKSI